MMSSSPHPARTAGPTHRVERPQGWQIAQMMKRGSMFWCYRCLQPFITRDQFQQHVHKEPTLCPKYCQNRQLNDEAFKNAAPPKEEKDSAYEQDADIDKNLRLAFKMFMSEIPRWEDIGKPDIDDRDECDRRSDEWKLASNVAARKRGEKVIYSWTKRQ